MSVPTVVLGILTALAGVLAVVVAAYGFMKEVKNADVDGVVLALVMMGLGACTLAFLLIVPW